MLNPNLPAPFPILTIEQREANRPRTVPHHVDRGDGSEPYSKGWTEGATPPAYWKNLEENIKNFKIQEYNSNLNKTADGKKIKNIRRLLKKFTQKLKKNKRNKELNNHYRRKVSGRKRKTRSKRR
tara:strand:+ start:5822 stop:6196 length:375 start_codon:yes stop_codon:yes gene_type:complete